MRPGLPRGAVSINTFALFPSWTMQSSQGAYLWSELCRAELARVPNSHDDVGQYVPLWNVNVVETRFGHVRTLYGWSAYRSLLTCLHPSQLLLNHSDRRINWELWFNIDPVSLFSPPPFAHPLHSLPRPSLGNILAVLTKPNLTFLCIPHPAHVTPSPFLSPRCLRFCGDRRPMAQQDNLPGAYRSVRHRG